MHYEEKISQLKQALSTLEKSDENATLSENTYTTMTKYINGSVLTQDEERIIDNFLAIYLPPKEISFEIHGLNSNYERTMLKIIPFVLGKPNFRRSQGPRMTMYQIARQTDTPKIMTIKPFNNDIIKAPSKNPQKIIDMKNVA